ncbi:MAG TPA: hypothetical protein DD618_00260 [Acholeplasmatales bacterium]|nr:hypothetical protein [Acholeplasmatales bacterium]
MKRLFKRCLSEKAIMAFSRVIKKTSKTLTLMVLFAMLANYFPWSLIKEPAVEAETQTEIPETGNANSGVEIDPSLVPIDFEVTDKRAQTEKHFRKIDGTYEAVLYDCAVHYEEDGKWQDIDNTLDDLGEEYENKKNDFKIKLPKALDDNKGISVKYDDYKITWNLTGIDESKASVGKSQNGKSDDLRSLPNVSQTTTYKNIKENVDLEYNLIGNSLKENFILNAYTEYFNIDFYIKTQGLSLIEKADELVFENSLGEEVFYLDRLFMFDANEEVSYEVLHQLIKIKDGEYRLTITPSDEWLKNAAFPVVIDPTLYSSTTSMAIGDTYVKSSAPNTNFGGMKNIILSDGVESRQYRGLINFTIPSSILDQTITYSRMTLTKSAKTGRYIKAYQNTAWFSEDTITWNLFEANDVCGDEVIDYHEVGTDPKYVFDITESVKEWQAAADPAEDYIVPGFTLVDAPLENNTVYSSECDAAASKPVITIGYMEPAGLKDDWTYTSQELGAVGTGYVGDYTGNLTFTRTDFSISNEIMPFSLDFIYNVAGRSSNIGYGKGWKTNYNLQVLPDSSNGSYYLQKPDGNKVYFMDETFAHDDRLDLSMYISIAEDGSKQKLIRDYYNDTLLIRTTTGVEYYFSPNGRLFKIDVIDKNATLFIEYINSTSQKIDYIADEVGNKIDITYDATNSRITKAELKLHQTGGTLRTVQEKQYYFDYAGNLDYIYDYCAFGTAPNNTMAFNCTLQYAFSSGNLLNNAYNSLDEYQAAYQYDTQNRVSKVTYMDSHYSLGFLSIAYGLNKTTFTDQEGNYATYLFDHYGHTINITDSQGNASFYRYTGLFTFISMVSPENPYYYPEVGFDLTNVEPNYYNNNKLIGSSSPQNQKPNPIFNHGFETNNEPSGGWTFYEGTNGNIAYTNNDPMLGNYCLSIQKVTSAVYASQTVPLEAGTYTIEGWIKNEGTAGGAYIHIDDDIGHTQIYKILDSEGWEKYELMFQISTERTVTLRLVNESASTACFDNLQIVEGFVDSRYNVLNNSSFENGTSGWTLSGATHQSLSETGIMQSILGDSAIHITGSPDIRKYFSMDITDLVTTNESLVIGGWAKGNAVPNKATIDEEHAYEPNSDGRFFGLELSADVVDPSGSEPICTYHYYFSFNSSTEDWQYQAFSVFIPDRASNIKIKGIYQGEGGAFFDNLQIYHDRLETNYSYDTTGNLVKIAYLNGEVTTFAYDANDQVTGITENGIPTTIGRNACNQINQVSKNNVKVSFAYNAVTRELLTTTYGDTADKWFSTSTTYSSDKQYISSTKNEFGESSGGITDQSIGAITILIDAMNNEKYLGYNQFGQITSIEEIDVTSGSTPFPSRVSTNQYDDQGRLVSIVLNGMTYEFVYDDLDRVTSIEVNDSSLGSTEYVDKLINGNYYQTDLVENLNFQNGDVINYVYDDNDNLSKLTFNSVLRYEYEYDGSGRLAIYKDLHNNNLYFYSYNLAGRLKKISDKDGNKISYVYDEAGNVAQYSYEISNASRGVHYHYNEATGKYDYTQYDLYTNGNGYGITNDYRYSSDSLKRLNEIQLVSKNTATDVINTLFTKSIEYDDAKVDPLMGNATNRIYSITYSFNNRTYVFTYSYDANNNLTCIEEKQGGSTIEKYNYHYDGYGQLTREDYWDLGNGKYFTQTCVYDQNGNLTNSKKYAYTNPLNEVSGTPLEEMKYYYNTTGWTDQISLIEYFVDESFEYFKTFAYDASGNLISENNKTFAWDGKQLTEVTFDGNAIAYKYDDQGIRTQKNVNGVTTNYYLDGSRVLHETNGTDVIYYTYDASGAPLSLNLNGTEYFYVSNLQGDIIEIVDINGNRLVTYQYDAWGNLKNHSDYSGVNLASKNPYRYRSYRYDNETGYYYLQSRYYDPSIGRFISADNVGYLGAGENLTSYNLYAYCNNNPVMYSDPTGNFPILLILCGILLGGLISGVSSVITAPEGKRLAAFAGGFSGGFFGSVTAQAFMSDDKIQLDTAATHGGLNAMMSVFMYLGLNQLGVDGASFLERLTSSIAPSIIGLSTASYFESFNGFPNITETLHPINKKRNCY